MPPRWVPVRDPKGQLPPRAYFSTVLGDTPESILTTFIQRWAIEVTFEECRAHLGIETQRQWSDAAVAHTTPVLWDFTRLSRCSLGHCFPMGTFLLNIACYSKTNRIVCEILGKMPTITHSRYQ